MSAAPIRHSGIYEGWVRHRRHAPVRNHFRYRLYMLYLDLDELPRLFRKTGLWSLGRRNLAWFRRADYLGPADVPLDVAVRDLVERETGRRPEGPVRMLTQVRTFGYVFNPVTFYYCFDAAGERVDTIVTHITNTPWGERFAYVHTRAEEDASGRRKRFRFPKAFHVSPFMRMAQDYDWRYVEPGERIFVHMETREDGRAMLDATLALERRRWSAGSLHRVLLRHPFMTFKVIAAIHWQALRLWWKRTPFFAHPSHARGSDHVPDAAPTGARTQPAEGRAASGPQPGARPSEEPGRREPVHS
ncbi:MAG: DUF1365 domain-containing protein [Planctomycetota bacterium]|nr:DUF1365 domain-containing protein [Planctomycetota bacterium]